MFKGKKIRIAKPASDLQKTEEFYTEALKMEVLGRFNNHAGYDGIMLGYKEQIYHLEFTYARDRTVLPTPTVEDLLVIYLPEKEEYDKATAHIQKLGYKPVEAHNPYWSQRGKTFVDPDGYRIVIVNSDY